ncbi:hypothetical protein EW145_g1312 [Phellinidium pouzarii]|uniref:Pet127-domain-containing protein n=1 Tax=Phellinidium pouzarii TaxID=167371 RepID=A0A4V3XDN8_9AGAM|nr:hypothetical protein EW145_g1312 [Phellinidium pouzarii]
MELTNGMDDGSGLKRESWKGDNWEDTLTPKPWPKREHHRSRPVIGTPLYVRRIEGLIEPSVKDVLEELDPPDGKTPIPLLAHGLDRVLFNPGVHWVQDPRSHVYNFPPFIQHIPDVKEFAFERLTPFIKSSKDTVMRTLASAKGKRFAGSTSSLSGLLSQIYFLISQGREVNTGNLAKPFSDLSPNFTPGQRMPAAVVFNYRDDVYMVDSDSADDEDSQWNILLWMGTMLENFFTLPKDEFEKLMRSSTPEATVARPREAYRYSQSKTFVMRSQLDCHDPRLPGTGVFDIKTRAALPIRIDTLNFKENSSYLIQSLHGSIKSFDREYYDLIRSAFLKYSFQARIGNMDGVFVAHHNTARIFGFQYISLNEMDECLFGAGDRGWRVFDKCVSMLEVVAGEIAECFPGKSVACLAETLGRSGVLRVWVQPIEDERNAEGLPEVSTKLQNPIVQLDVTVDNYHENVCVNGETAIKDVLSPWTLQWAVARSPLPDWIIRRNLADAKSRKFKPISYPTGVNSGNLEDFLKSLGFGDVESIPPITHFVEADKGIQTIRNICRDDRRIINRLDEELKLKEKQVWRQPASYNDALVRGFGKSEGDSSVFPTEDNHISTATKTYRPRDVIRYADTATAEDDKHTFLCNNDEPS